VTDLTADQVVDRCRTYWLGSGVSTATADEMAAELTAHLAEASAAGKSIEMVTGDDIDEFAEEWAAAYRGPRPASSDEPSPTPPSLPRTANRAPGWIMWLGALAIVALVILVAVLAPDDEAMDQAVWVGLWLVAAALLAVGEMLTAGFFLLPFAIGAAAAGVLALATVAVPLQIVTFVVVSIGSLLLLQQFAQKDIHGELLPVGAARYIGASALVMEPVSRLHNTGWVKMGTEDWRATTDGNDEIPVSTEVKVVEVRGARLVVEPADKR
jgi:membrane protein implicated in regulation of membrane protease activity